MKSLLSIQSHVVHGYVGNKAATFPLQYQGWNVDALNSVNFSNHTGYGQVYGTKTSSDEISELYKGLANLDLTYHALLTGYIPGAESVSVVGEILNDFKLKNPDTLWLLDPVMGDEGQLYVSEDVIPAYQKILSLKNVDIITPNQFEAELLVGYKITDIATLKQAIQDIHTNYNVKYVVISSLILDGLSIDIQNDSSCVPQSSKFIYAVTSSLSSSNISLFKIPCIDSYFTGVGDLFSALLIDRMYKNIKLANKNSLNDSVSEVLSVMIQVLHTTHKLGIEESKGLAGKSTIGDGNSMKHFELRVIECREFYGEENQAFKWIDL